jgi:hypothetical protein
LVWIIRTAATGGLDRELAADLDSWYTDQLVTDVGSGHADMPDITGPEDRLGPVRLIAASTAGPLSPIQVVGPDQARGPDSGSADHGDQKADQSCAISGEVGNVRDASATNAAAVAAYLASLEAGRPLSERKLAETFGKTSRRWARSRMAEAMQNPSPVSA